MARYSDREHAIPLRKPELVRLLLRHLDSENPAELTHFRELCRLIEAILHFEFHERLECVKEFIRPFRSRHRSCVSGLRNKAAPRFVGECCDRHQSNLQPGPRDNQN
jgi:hypothetical protein